MTCALFVSSGSLYISALPTKEDDEREIREGYSLKVEGMGEWGVEGRRPADEGN